MRKRHAALRIKVTELCSFSVTKWAGRFLSLAVTFTAGARCPLSRVQWLAQHGAGKLRTAPHLDRSLNRVITVHTRTGAGRSARGEEGKSRNGTRCATDRPPLSPVPDIVNLGTGSRATQSMHHHAAYKNRSRQSSPGETSENVAVPGSFLFSYKNLRQHATHGTSSHEWTRWTRAW